MARRRFPGGTSIPAEEGAVGMGEIDIDYDRLRAAGLPMEDIDPSDPSLGVPTGTHVAIPGMGRSPVANDGGGGPSPVEQQTGPAIPDDTAMGGVPMMRPETQMGGTTDDIPDEALGIPDYESEQANTIVQAAQAGDAQAQAVLAQAARRRLMRGAA